MANITFSSPKLKKDITDDTKHMVPKSRSHSAKTEAPININITNLEPPMMPHLTPKHHPLPKPWTTTHQTCASVQNNHLQTHNDEAPQHRCPQTAANTPEPREALAVQILYYTSIRHPSAPAPAHVGPHNLQEQETSTSKNISSSSIITPNTQKPRPQDDKSAVCYSPVEKLLSATNTTTERPQRPYSLAKRVTPPGIRITHTLLKQKIHSK